jgi:hypothetical protein
MAKILQMLKDRFEVVPMGVHAKGTTEAGLRVREM